MTDDVKSVGFTGFIKNIFSLNSNGNASNRIEVIDFIRGIAMIIVVLGHVGFPHTKWLYGFHMSVFFIISGFLNYNKDARQTGGGTARYGFIDEVRKQGKRLLVPYLAFELINLALSYCWTLLSDNSICLKDALISIVTCLNIETYQGLSLRFWFLPCMYISSIAMWVIRKYLQKNKTKGLLTVLLFCVSWFLSIVYNERLPFTLDISIMAIAYMLVGYVTGPIIGKFLYNELSNITVLLSAIAATVIYAICIIFNPSTIYMYINEYGNYFFAIVGAVSGSWVVIVCSRLLWLSLININYSIASILKSLVLWYGKNSLVAFPVHLEGKLFVRKLVDVLMGSNWIVEFVLMLLIIIPICNFITYYMPFLLGNFSRRTALENSKEAGPKVFNDETR